MMYMNGLQIHFPNTGKCPQQFKWLQEQMDLSLNLEQAHFEHRTGTVNFSVVGRGADAEQRELYVKWDNKLERTYCPI